MVPTLVRHPMTAKNLRPALMAAAVLAFTHAVPAWSAAESLLHSFAAPASDGSNTDGSAPDQVLVHGNDGNFYGTAFYLGPGFNGTVFKMTPSGAVTVLHAFGPSTENPNGGDTSADGADPRDLALGADGMFYGVAGAGGAHGNGTVFRIAPDGSFTLLHTFSVTDGACDSCGSNTDGTRPARVVPVADGSLYGIAGGGGANALGTFFKIDGAGHFSTIASFTAGQPAPGELQLGSDGNFYGLTDSSIVKLTPNGNYSIMHTLSASVEGSSAQALIIGRDGNFYGTTGADGANGNGSLFKVTLAGTTTVLHAFGPTNTILVFDLYAVPRWHHVSFVNGEGTRPESLIQGSDGSLYGANLTGGVNDYGTIYKLDPDGAFTLLYTFGSNATTSSSADALEPGPLTDDGNGNLIGGSYMGGAGSTGAIFKLSMNAPLSVAAAFTPATVKLGEPTQLSWSSTAAQSCAVKGVVPGMFIGKVATSGHRKVTPRSTWTIQPGVFFATVVCTGADDSQATAAATLSINSP